MKKKIIWIAKKKKKKNGEWEKFLDAILIELLGFNEEAKTIELLLTFT